MATDAKKITHSATTEILCFTLDPKSYDEVTIRCVSTAGGTLKTLYQMGDGEVWADDTSDTVTGTGSSAARTMNDSSGTSLSLGTVYQNMKTVVFGYRLGKTLVTFTPDSSSGTLYIEAITSKEGEK